MAISKDKMMLQIPVKKSVANEFIEMSKKTGISKGDLFVVIFLAFEQRVAERVKQIKKENLSKDKKEA